MAEWNARGNGAMYGDWYMPAYILPGYSRDPYEYPGYFNNLVTAPGQYPPFAMLPSETSGKSEKSGKSEDAVKSESNFKLDKNAHKGSPAKLAWSTERPTRMRVPICCDDCRKKLRSNLEDLPGVHDVGIEGWSSALVTVTGTAREREILQTARTVSPTAAMWGKSDSIDEFNAKTAYAKQH